MAALKLGAKQVFSVDIDDQALQATQNNAQTNAITEPQLLISSPEHLQNAADLMIANILLAPLMKLKERFHELLKSGSLLVVSGILNEQESLLVDAYQGFFTLQGKQQLEGWSLLVFKRL